MNRRGPFVRKVVYLVLVALLLFPIAMIGAPATRTSSGGVLAKLRAEHDLGQADLGEIDPASETMRLVTLGLRNIAASILWNKANYYKMTENWTAFESTVLQLSRLQPYFISFWKYQGWNLSYNVSVELDDVQDRYYYVKRGINFLKEGIKYNEESPYLLSELGWFIGNKIGRADEHIQYRRLFKNDDDFHPTDRPPGQRDNWLVSKEWNQRSVNAVEVRGKSLGQKNPTTFYAAPAMSQMNYGEAIEKEGVFGDRARRAWATAEELWQNYGNREMRASNGMLIRLNDKERWETAADDWIDELDAIEPGLKKRMEDEAYDSLTEEERIARNLSFDERTPEQVKMADEADERLHVTYEEVADRIAEIKPEAAAEARRLATQINEANTRARYIRTNRDVVNFDYWDARARFEQTADALNARRLAHEALRQFRDEANPEGARELYEESFDLWTAALDDSPDIPVDSATGSDIMIYIEEYVDVLGQLDLSLADPELAEAFPLWHIVDANDSEGVLREELELYQTRQATGADSDQPKSLINPADALVD